jgi:hypothetical protein
LGLACAEAVLIEDAGQSFAGERDGDPHDNLVEPSQMQRTTDQRGDHSGADPVR